jgi:hypothetical protein
MNKIYLLTFYANSIGEYIKLIFCVCYSAYSRIWGKWRVANFIITARASGFKITNGIYFI